MRTVAEVVVGELVQVARGGARGTRVPHSLLGVVVLEFLSVAVKLGDQVRYILRVERRRVLDAELERLRLLSVLVRQNA